MKIDLSDLKVGDVVFDSVQGLLVVHDIDGITQNVVARKHASKFTYNRWSGKYYECDPHPRLFHSFEEFKKYWEYQESIMEKPKKRFHRYRLRHNHGTIGAWFISTHYLDENGKDTIGDLQNNFARFEAVKIEDDFVEA